MMQKKNKIFTGILLTVLLLSSFLMIISSGFTIVSFFYIYTMFISTGTSALIFICFQSLLKSIWTVDLEKIAMHFSDFVIYSLILIPYFILVFFLDDNDIINKKIDYLSQQSNFLSIYYNSYFFISRMFVLYLIWIYIYIRIRNKSRNNGVNLILMFFSVTLFSIDMLSIFVNMDHIWYSSIFGVYFILSGLSGTFALVIILYLITSKYQTKEVKYNIGKYFFALNALWAYVAFSQYLIIWYGNLPEEVGFFAVRMNYGWENLALFIAFFHFLLPFIMLLPKSAKNKNSILLIASIMVVLAYMLEIYWIIFPSYCSQCFSITFDVLITFFFISSVLMIHPLRKMKYYNTGKL